MNDDSDSEFVDDEAQPEPDPDQHERERLVQEIRERVEREHALREAASRLIRLDPCRGRCLQGQAANLEVFLENLSSFSSREKRLCICTSLSILALAEASQPLRVRSTGVRIRFRYFVPFVGHVCRTTFLNCFEISAPTLGRYTRRIRAGRLTWRCLQQALLMK